MLQILKSCLSCFPLQGRHRSTGTIQATRQEPGNGLAVCVDARTAAGDGSDARFMRGLLFGDTSAVA